MKLGDLVQDRWYPDLGVGRVVVVAKTRIYVKFPYQDDDTLYDVPHQKFLEIVPMSNKPNPRRGEARRTEHGPRHENPNPGKGANATHVARARRKHKVRARRKARRMVQWWIVDETESGFFDLWLGSDTKKAAKASLESDVDLSNPEHNFKIAKVTIEVTQ